jgi:hypothetical protein
MEELMRSGRVTVNGSPATIGARVGPSDVIQVNGQALSRSADRIPARVLIYYKPEGEIVSRDDPGGRPSVFDQLPQLVSVSNHRFIRPTLGCPQPLRRNVVRAAAFDPEAGVLVRPMRVHDRSVGR